MRVDGGKFRCDWQEQTRRAMKAESVSCRASNFHASLSNFSLKTETKFAICHINLAMFNAGRGQSSGSSIGRVKKRIFFWPKGWLPLPGMPPLSLGNTAQCARHEMLRNVLMQQQLE